MGGQPPQKKMGEKPLTSAGEVYKAEALPPSIEKPGGATSTQIGK